MQTPRAKRKRNEKAYDDHTDLEKIQRQWKKLSGLRSRREWSAAVVRAATAAEIAANLAVRSEFAKRSQFDPAFVDDLLKWANGLSGKLEKLLTPLHRGGDHERMISTLRTTAKPINDKRNAIVHRGEFCSEAVAKEVVAHAKLFVETLVGLYEPGFELTEVLGRKRRRAKPKRRGGRVWRRGSTEKASDTRGQP
jgi:hypothetical protein